MGRRPHQFLWENVDKLPNGEWSCKHCNNKFKGSASRIRNHLSGEGTDISSCKEVPEHIRKKASEERGRNSSPGKGNEASKRPTSGEGKEVPSEIRELAMIINSKKRGRNSSSSEEGNDGISSVANIGDLSSSKGREQEFTTTDLLVKFFVSRNIPLDAVKDPYFRTLLTRVDGFPSCLLRGDSVGIQRSISNLEYEVNQYMVTVKESWKTTGCTVIRYKLDEWRGNPSSSKAESVVHGFYCPKGFIFVEIDESKHLGDTLKNHVLNLPVHDVTRQIYHYGYQGCELAKGFDDEFVYEFDDEFYIGNRYHCAHQRFEQLWKKIYTESGWVRNVTQKSENLYESMLNSNFKGESWEKVKVQNDGDATPRSAFTRLRSIMHLEDSIKEWISSPFGKRDVREIVNNNEFWSAGKELLKVVNPLLQLIDIVDTLVPTSGYLNAALDKAKRNLKPYYEQDASKYQIIWDWLDGFDKYSHEVANFFSPFYEYWRSTKGGYGPYQSNIIEDCLGFDSDEEEYEKLDAELKVYRYNHPFAYLPCYNHPVTLWKKYGGGFPMLQKIAIKHMSQPTSCMCNQVKKHVLHCKGADNFILRLNYHMMQEFTKLDDRIYEPLGTRIFQGLHDTPPLHPIDRISQPKYLGEIPAWMNEFILNSIDVDADGNCGYRAIAESVGLGQDKWREVRQQLYDELISQPQLYEPTFVHGDVETISKALLYHGSGFAPPETWLKVKDMGLLVATTFKAKFVVLGSPIDMCCTYLPLYLPEGYQSYYVPAEIVVCLGYNLHFSSLSLTDNAPLPPISYKWEIYHRPSTQDFDLFLSDRCASYEKAAT